MAEREKSDAPHIDAEAARGGEIILRSRKQRAIFIGGLVGAGIVVILLAIA